MHGSGVNSIAIAIPFDFAGACLPQQRLSAFSDLEHFETEKALDWKVFILDGG
jgi:hypothetical protein